MRQVTGDLREQVRQCGELPGRAASAGKRPADALSGELIVERARQLVGVRFRLHGRDAGGLDCVGVVAAALGRTDAPAGYAMRGGTAGGFAEMLNAAGLARVEAASAGDVLLLEAGPRQFHLGVWTGDSLVHAHAGLRRVVETPGAPRWPVIGIWRGAE